MPEARSINQNPPFDTLPDFRRLGVVLRAVLIVNAVALLAVLAQADSWGNMQVRLLQVSALLEPVLLCSLLLLYGLNTVLSRLPYWHGAGVAMLGVGLVGGVFVVLGGELFVAPGESLLFHIERTALLGSAAAGLLLEYLRLRARALSPAFYGARLQALQARIRPHFLYNTLNAVLSIIRTQPKRAETALEDMSDLFRMAMSDEQELVTLRSEIELSRQYLALEQLRLGERLQVDWQLGDLPPDALIPPFILQPLLENAVYHGVEPLAEGGRIEVQLYGEDRELHLRVRNPAGAQPVRSNGNKIALSNIRERLALLFDIEARYEVEAGAGHYQVHIMMPYVKEGAHE